MQGTVGNAPVGVLVKRLPEVGGESETKWSVVKFRNGRKTRVRVSWNLRVGILQQWEMCISRRDAEDSYDFRQQRDSL